MKKLSLILLFLFSISSLFSQPYIEMMYDSTANFYDIQDAFNKYWEGRNPNVKGKGYKQFKHWENFWQSHTPMVEPLGATLSCANGLLNGNDEKKMLTTSKLY